MSGLRRRLEARTMPPAPLRPGPTTLDEIRRLEAEIRAEGGTVEREPLQALPVDLEALEREIGALEAGLDTA